MPELFRGPLSLTYSGERVAFFLTLLFAFPAAAFIGFLIHEEVTEAQIALFLVIAMVYVTLARGRLVGSSVQINQTQYPRVFAIVERCAAALGVPMPLVFVREDYAVPVIAVGFGEPYSLVLSSHWIEHFEDDELTFMIGRELGHIAAGHVRFTSLLSVNGNENALVSLVFGAWLRKMELTCDRVGLLCCGSMESAIRAIAIASFHHFGRNIDHEAFAAQARDVQRDSVFRLGEWLGGVPYATTRIDAMRRFMQSELYRIHEQRFVTQSPLQPIRLPQSTGMHVEKIDCAGWWRRLSAVLVDLIIVAALLQTLFGGHHAEVKDTTSTVVAAKAGSATRHTKVNDEPMTIGGYSIGGGGIMKDKHTIVSWPQLTTSKSSTPFWFAFYAIVLVSLAGQTPGMLITGLRVVRTDFGPPRPGQVIWRYAIVALLWPLVLLLSVFSRVYMHDKLSGTRLIKTERVLARAATA